MSVATAAPSTLKSTLCTATLSEAVAVTVVVPEMLAPFAGAVIATVGSWLSTVIVTFEEVLVFPAVSRATALSVWVPFDERGGVQRQRVRARGVGRAHVGPVHPELHALHAGVVATRSP